MRVTVDSQIVVVFDVSFHKFYIIIIFFFWVEIIFLEFIFMKRSWVVREQRDRPVEWGCVVLCCL